MSGHSHFKTIKATKDANDAKKGKIFSKLGRVITLAAKEKGGDIAINAKLKALIDKAREFNMPKENIERAIKKGTGELAGENLEEVSFEGFGPAQVAIILEGITDNKNRTIGEVKNIITKYGGKMAGEGAVRWMFDRKGIITATLPQTMSREDIELLVIEAGAEDIVFEDQKIIITTSPEQIETVKKQLQPQLTVEEASLSWVPKEEITLDEKDRAKAQELFEALDENDDIQDIYSNIKN